MTKRPLFVSLLIILLISLAVTLGYIVNIPRHTNQAFPHNTITQLSDAVDELVVSKTLAPGREKALMSSLDEAKAELNQGNAQQVKTHLGIFKRDIKVLIKTGMLSPQAGQPLIDKATEIQERLEGLEIGGWIAKPLPFRLTGCVEKPPCRYTILHVSGAARFQGEAEGSRERPFSTIGEALEYGKNLDVCGIEVWISKGSYDDDLILSRSTRIQGDSKESVIIVGSILNYGGYDLSVQDVTIRDTNDHGGIIIDAPCATTFVMRVLIDQVQRYGIYQRGGTLTIIGTEIRETRAEADSIAAGTGIYLSGGVQAGILSTDIHRNESAGLIIQGAETRVYAGFVTISENQVNPYFQEQINLSSYFGLGAVQVRQGALLLMEFSHISENYDVGLSIYDNAKSHFRGGTISSTQAVEIGDDNYGGHNIWVINSDLQVSNFTISQASLAGVMIVDALVTLSDGTVENNAIGVAIRSLDEENPRIAPLSCLLNHVLYIDNGINLDGSSLPIPEPIEGIDLSGFGLFGNASDTTHLLEENDCVEVPFICEWCGEDG